MAFLDNSGDIILDAVLTDTGRYRLAQGDGSFRIAKFALGDDEINYELYNKTHASGSAYYDLEILQTPCLEAFTNNTSMLKSPLMSLSRTNILYLPVIKLSNDGLLGFAQNADVGTHVVCVDNETFSDATSVTNAVGLLNGSNVAIGGRIKVDQGLDTTSMPPTQTLESDLVETQYIIQIDNRFGSIASSGGTPAKVSFIDDDNVASYYLSLGTDSDFVSNNTNTDVNITQPISGPRGTSLMFKIQASIELNSSTYLFQKMGSSALAAAQVPELSPAADIYYIDSLVRVRGATTGYSLDIPVRFVKKQ